MTNQIKRSNTENTERKRRVRGDTKKSVMFPNLEGEKEQLALTEVHRPHETSAVIIDLLLQLENCVE